MATTSKSHVCRQPYVSALQLTLDRFETSYKQKPDPFNRRVVLANTMPWEKLAGLKLKLLNNYCTGVSAINLRAAIGAVITKHV